MPDLFDDFLFGAVESREISSRKFYRENFSEIQVIDFSSANSDIPSVICAWLKSKLGRQLEFLEKIDYCTYCGAQYQRRMNIGTMNCRYHPFPGSGMMNECCGRPKSALGCTACDHKPVRPDTVERWTRATASIIIPMYLRHEFDFPDASIEKHHHNAENISKSYIVVKRVGVQEPYRQFYPMKPIY